MAVTVQSQIDRLIRSFTDITDAVALDYLQDANRELCFSLPIYLTEEDITLTADTQEYTINADDLRVWSGHYWESATFCKSLEGMTLRGLDLRHQGWRNTPASIPSKYVVFNKLTVPTLRLFPKPNRTTTGGYPFVRLRVSRYVALTQVGDLPGSLIAPDVYYLKAAEQYALDHDLGSRLKEIRPMLASAMRTNLQGLDFKVVDSPKATWTPVFPGVSR